MPGGSADPETIAAIESKILPWAASINAGGNDAILAQLMQRASWPVRSAIADAAGVAANVRDSVSSGKCSKEPAGPAEKGPAA